MSVYANMRRLLVLLDGPVTGYHGACPPSTSALRSFIHPGISRPMGVQGLCFLRALTFGCLIWIPLELRLSVSGTCFRPRL